MRLGVERRQRAPDHHLHDRVRRHLVPFQRAGAAAVAQHRDAVRELVHLRHAVRDVDDRDPVRAKLADQREQPVGFARRQRRGRLVQHQDARLPIKCPCDFHQLLLGDRQGGHRRVRPERGAQPLQDRPARLRHRAAVQPPAGAAYLVAEMDVLRYRKVRRQRQLLVDDGDPGILGRLWPVDLDLLAEHPDRAPRIGPVRAGQHLHQGGLAGPVLAHQRQHLAAPRVEPYAGQGAHAGKCLRDALHLQGQRPSPLPVHHRFPDGFSNCLTWCAGHHDSATVTNQTCIFILQRTKFIKCRRKSNHPTQGSTEISPIDATTWLHSAKDLDKRILHRHP